MALRREVLPTHILKMDWMPAVITTPQAVMVRCLVEVGVKVETAEAMDLAVVVLGVLVELDG